VAAFEKLAALAPHARILRLENSGHQGFMEEPEKVCEAMLAFLKSLPEV
jgi:pimeloyl-ACP methyl ester carboxylesterase